jgi:hypothetical protein
VQEAPPTKSNIITTVDRLARCRAKRGLSKLPILLSGAKHVIALVDSAREPIEPVVVMGSYKMAIEVLVKDNIPIKYRY